MNQTGREGDNPKKFNRFLHIHSLPPYVPFLVWGGGGVAAIVGWWDLLNWVATLHPFNIRLFLDVFDLKVIFQSSSWVVGGGRLYREVSSEYPFLANLLFGFVRWLDVAFETFVPSFLGFVYLWTLFAWAVFIEAVSVFSPRKSAWIWLTPAAVYFSLYRYDIYPVACCLLALREIERDRILRGSLWLGICLALKGYALFTLPALGYFVWQKRSRGMACKAVGLALLPFVVANLLVLVTLGFEALKAPYTFHLVRGWNGESTMDGVAYALNWLGMSDQQVQGIRNFALVLPWLGKSLLIGAGLGGLFLKPDTFDGLVRAMLFSIVAFVSLTTFYSPQYVLWMLGIGCFLQDRHVLCWLLVYSLLTFLYFPVAYDLHAVFMYRLLVFILAGMRVALLVRLLVMARREVGDSASGGMWQATRRLVIDGKMGQASGRLPR